MKSNFKFVVALILVLAAGNVAAEQVQSTTGAYVTFRQCIEGETACDSLSETKIKSFGGLPGDSEAQASQEDPVYGSSSGLAKLTDVRGSAEMSANANSRPGARNGGNVFFLQRYTNSSNYSEKLTLDATLTYDQTVPGENSAFTENGGAHSVANAELELFTLSIDTIEAGTTSEDNNMFLHSPPPPDVEYQLLDNTAAEGVNNVTGAGSAALAVSTVIPPGESIWLLGILQALGSNGAVVKAGLETTSVVVRVD